MNLAGLLSISAFGLVAPSAAWAQGSPFVVSNPGVGDMPELKIDVDYRSRGDRDLVRTRAELTVPIAARTELSVQVQHRILHQLGSAAVRGLGDTSVSMKFYVLRPEESVLGVAIGIEPEFSFPTGDANAGLGAGSVEFTVPLMIVKEFGPLKLGGELSYAHRFGGGEGLPGIAALAMYRLSPLVRLGAEVASQAPRFKRVERTTDLNLGFKFDFTPHAQFYGIVGQSLERPERAHEWRLRSGFRFNL